MVSNEAVTEIDGVGSGTADNLVDSGFETVGDVAEAGIDELSKVKGFGEVKAEETIEEAQSMLEGESDSEDESEMGTQEVAESGSIELPNAEFETDEETYDVTVDLDHQVGYHLIHVVLEEATSQHQSSDFKLRDDTYRLAEKLMVPFLKSEDTFETDVSLTEQELNAFYRAVNNGSLDYSSRPGISEMYGDLNTLRERINDKRKEIRSN